jgi:hypothetical protein
MSGEFSMSETNQNFTVAMIKLKTELAKLTDELGTLSVVIKAMSFDFEETRKERDALAKENENIKFRLDFYESESEEEDGEDNA